MAEADPYPESNHSVSLLLLGDPGCGKSTFLSWVPGRPTPQKPAVCNLQMVYGYCYIVILLYGDMLIWSSRLKSGRPLPSGPSNTDANTLELLRDGDQPFIYDIRFSKKTFTLELYDTSNPNQHWTNLRPDVAVLAYDISNRNTLAGLKEVSLIYTFGLMITSRWIPMFFLVAKWHYALLPIRS